MASSQYSPAKPHRNEELECAVIRGKDDNNNGKNREFRCLKLELRRELHKRIDLNRFDISLPLLDSNEKFYFPIDYQSDFYNKVGKRWLEEDIIMRSLAKSEPRENEGVTNDHIDLDLKLSPPNEYYYSSIVLPNRSKCSSISQEKTCVSKSFDVNPNYKHFDCAASEVEISSLVLMGCTHCLIYVMVSKVGPKCPKCKSSILIDMFCTNRSFKRRRNIS